MHAWIGQEKKSYMLLLFWFHGVLHSTFNYTVSKVMKTMHGTLVDRDNIFVARIHKSKHILIPLFHYHQSFFVVSYHLQLTIVFF